jgi:hypothetical protein
MFPGLDLGRFYRLKMAPVAGKIRPCMGVELGNPGW